jgi:hypothetical protein
MKGKDKISQATKDLQQIVDATQARIKAQPNQLETMATPTDSIQIQQAPRVQTPTREPIPHTNDIKRITRSMTTTAPVPRVPNIRVPTCKPTADSMEATRRERVQKQRTAGLGNTTTTITAPPRIRTRAQRATAAAQAAPPALCTRLRAQQSSIPPPSQRSGFMAAVMQQQQHQRGMVQITRQIRRLENEVHQAMAIIDADTGKLLNYRQLMRSTKYRQEWSLLSAN